MFLKHLTSITMHWLKEKNHIIDSPVQSSVFCVLSYIQELCTLIFNAGQQIFLLRSISLVFVMLLFLNHILQLEMLNKPNLPDLFTSILHLFNDISQSMQRHHICRASFLWQPDQFRIITNLTFKPEILGAKLCPLPPWLQKTESPKIPFF